MSEIQVTEQLPPLLATAINQSNALANYMRHTSQLALLQNMGQQELEDLMIHYGTLHGGLCAQIYLGTMAKYNTEQNAEIISLLRQNNELLKDLIGCFQSPASEEIDSPIMNPNSIFPLYENEGTQRNL